MEEFFEKPFAIPVVVVVLLTLLGLFLLGIRATEPPDATEYQIERAEAQCVAEWTDIQGKTHCGHFVTPVGRTTDSLTKITVDVFHCMTDSVRIVMPVPRYRLAEAGMVTPTGAVNR